MLKQSRIDWFDALIKAQAQVVSNEFGLLVELQMDPVVYRQLKTSTMSYVFACLEKPDAVPSETELMALVKTHVEKLANRTPNGILLPKREFEDEFNHLHRVLASYIRTLGMDDSIYKINAPIIVRVVKGDREPDEEERPYASTKVHLDPWGGDPGDEVVVSIPMLGDIDRTTVEYFQPPNELENNVVHIMESYEQGQQLMGECEQIFLDQRLGYAYFMDAIIPHRTVKREGGVRVTVEFRLRRTTTEDERAEVEETCDPGRLAHFIDVSDWNSLGTTKQMKFSDTYADAKLGKFVKRPYNEPIYTTVDVSPMLFD